MPFENEPGERVTLEVPADQREQVDAVIEIVVDPLRGVVGVLDYRHLGNGAGQQLARFILDRDRNHGDLVSGAVYAEHFGRQACDVHLRLVRVPPRRYIGERRRPFMADCAEDAAMPAGDGIAARPGIGLLHVPGGENALILDQDDTDAVVARLVSPDARDDEFGRVRQVLVPIVADHAVRPLGSVAADRQRRVDEQIEPVHRLFDSRAALRPDGTGVAAAGEDALHGIGDRRQRRARRRGGEVLGAVGEKVLARHFRRLALRIAPGRRHPIEVELGARRDHARQPLSIDA